MKRINYPSGSPWEEIVGYSRAVKIGNVIEVSGTTATNAGIAVHVGDYYGQTRFILEKIQSCLQQAGASMNDVVRTRMYVCDISKWEDVAKAHMEFFSEIKPAATMVEVTNLISPDLLIEIEVTAIINQ